MTTLVMVGILVFGIVAYRRLPVSDLPTVDYPTITRQREPARREPGDDGAAVATPLEKQFSTIAGIDNMTSTSSLGLDAASRCSSRSTATSTPPRRTCRRRSRKTLRAAAAGHHSAVVPEGESGRRADPVLSRSRRPRCRSRSSTSTARRSIAQRLSMVDGVAQVKVYGAQKYAVRVQLDPDAARVRARSASTRSRTRSRSRTSTCRRACCTGRTTALHGAGERPAEERGRVPRRDRRLSQRRAGAPRRRSASVLDDVQNNKTRELVQRRRASIVLAVQRQPGTNTVEVAERVQGGARRSSKPQIPPAVQASRRCTTGRSTIRAVGARREVHARADARARRRW